MKKRPLTLQRLKEVLHYDPKTGIFTCLVNRRKARAGEPTGVITPDGYVQVTVDWSIYKAHRLAWFYMTGEWPKADEIDHRDLDGTNNRWGNIREATRSQNGANKPKQSNNTSGFKGVSAAGLRYRAYIVVGRKQIHLGMGRTPEEAHALYVAAAQKYYGEFARAA